MHDESRASEIAVWAAAEGTATAEQLAPLEADPRALAAHARAAPRRRRGRPRRRSASSTGPSGTRWSPTSRSSSLLEAAYDRLVSADDPSAAIARRRARPARSGSRRRGRPARSSCGRPAPTPSPSDNDALADRLEAIGGPRPRLEHPPRRAARRRRQGGRAVDPGGRVARLAGRRRRRPGDRTGVGRQRRLARPGGGRGRAPRGPGLGGPDPAGHQARSRAAASTSAVRWVPALVDHALLERAGRGHARRRHRRSAGGDARAVTLDVLGAVVDAIVGDGRRPARAAGAAARPPAPPPRWPRRSSPASTARRSRRPVAAGAEVSKRLDRWASRRHRRRRATARRAARPARLAATPGSSRCSAPAPTARCCPIELALADSKATKPLADELARLERILPALLRPGRAAPRPGVPEPGRGLGADDRHRRGARRPPASTCGCRRCRGASRRPGCACSPSPSGDTVVGAHQLSNVRWSAVFDDVELTAADIARLAAEARPLVRSRGKWVELDRADLKEAAAALAERADQPPSSPAPRSSATPSASRAPALAGGISGRGHAAGPPSCSSGRRRSRPSRSPSPRASTASCAATRPRRSAGSASSTPSSSAAASPSTWASARRRPCSPTSPAPPATGPALVIAPPAVVGNWAAEAARFTPGLRVVVHHGASRADGRRSSSAEVAGADVVITTYGTAVRDVEALAAPHVGPDRPRRGPGHQEPGQRDRPAAAPHPGAAPGSPSPARRSRTASATSGRSSTSPTPASSAPGRRSSPSCRARARPRCGRSTASSCSAAPRASPWSPPSCPTASTSSTTAR